MSLSVSEILLDFPDPTIIEIGDPQTEVIIEVESLPVISVLEVGFTSVAIQDTITATSALYIGPKTRIVAIPNGAALEVKDSSDVWQRQSTWTE